MTIVRDHAGKRKPSWESKISICTASTRAVGRSDTPSSILSSDSDIRFTRKLGGQYRCGCCILAGFLLFLLCGAASVYLAYTLIIEQGSDEQVFRVHFRVTEGDVFSSALADPSTPAFRTRARGYRERVNLVFRRSQLRPAFLKTDVLALDGREGEDLIVHLNVHFDARRMPVHVPDLIQVLSREITNRDPVYLANLTIPLESLSVKESSLDMSSSLPPVTTTVVAPTPQEVVRQCLPMELGYCSRMLHNVTSYPNLLGHRNYKQVLDDVIQFRELVDSECYRHAYEFVCHVLQPSCHQTTVKSPCRSFCHDFMRGCGERVSSLVKAALDCSRFPEMSTDGSCVPRPGCVGDLQSSGQGARLCDGVIDCPDLSDEEGCSYCPPGTLHCPASKGCVHRHQLCDGESDCPDGSDELGCLTLEPEGSITTELQVTRHRLHDSGFVVAVENGAARKVCVDGLNATEGEVSLSSVAQGVCRAASYAQVKSFQVEKDVEGDNSTSPQYVEVDDLEASRPLFLTTSCPEKQVLRVSCHDPVCGRQLLRPHSGVQGLAKMAAYGDWPWHVVLLKDGVHLCDGTLIAPDWVLTTASCFQGQSKAEWVAVMGGVVRLDSGSPWQQQRLVVGLLKSPVEGSTLALLNLHEPIVPSHFARAVCLPDGRLKPDNYTVCNTLGWATAKKQLQRVDLQMSPMGMCENMTITTVNSLCTASAYDTTDCSEEEFAGAPLVCIAPHSSSWTLVGVSNWRIGCQQPGIERPRMYDKVSSNIDWIRSTVAATAS